MIGTIIHILGEHNSRMEISHTPKGHVTEWQCHCEPFLAILHFRISNITMETAVETNEGSEFSGDMARSIESCICPTGYTGLSCQVNIQIM